MIAVRAFCHLLGDALDWLCAPWNGHLFCRFAWYRNLMCWAYGMEARDDD